MRFFSKDPIGLEAGDANLFRYVGNEPTNKTDPSGFDPPYSPMGAGSHLYDLGYEKAAREQSARRAAVMVQLRAAEAEHSGYQYYEECGIDQFFRKLRTAIPMAYFKPVPRDSLASIDASAYYMASMNTVYYDSKDGLAIENRGTMVHELIHALDDQDDWNFTIAAGVLDTYFRSDREDSESRAEGLAYLVGNMFGRGTYHLRRLEDELKAGKFFANAAFQEMTPEEYAQDRWRNACSNFRIYGTSSVFYSREMRKLDALDFTDAEKLLGLQFRLSDLKPIYERLLKDKGVDVILLTPDQVPQHLR